MAYATVEDVANGFRTLTADEESTCGALLEEAAVITDAYNENAPADRKKLVSCRMVRRVLGDGNGSAGPIGSTQGSMGALGYSQSWTLGTGSVGELYLGKLEKKLLSVDNRIGCHSPLEDL